VDLTVLATIGLAVWGVFLVLGMPIAFASALVGFVGLFALKGWGAAGDAVAFLSYRITADYNLTVIPLFIIMGYFAHFAGLTGDLFNTMRKWIGHLPGGLAIATIFGCAGFAACSGSSAAAAAVMGKATIPEMRKVGYDPKLATGVVAASGTMASLIPPSNMTVIYGIITQQSIGVLLVAGFIPGLFEAVSYSLITFFIARFRPKLAPVVPAASWRERVNSLKGVWGVLAIMVVVLGGLYLGIFTPTEAAGVAAFGTFVIALALRKVTWANLKESLYSTAKTTAMIFAVLVGVLILLRFLALTGLLDSITRTVLLLPVHRMVILFGIIIVYLILGMFVTALGMMMITIPIFYPVIIQLGFDPIWFGIIVIKMVEIALITPPVGMNVFVVKSVAPEVPMWDIFKGTFPYLSMDVMNVTAMIIFPQIILWVPSTMMR
jgi:tripartite ATP-independent transporter DctM subunit